MKTIASEWEAFSRCIPSGAPEVQRNEMRRAFYGGCTAMFALLVTQVTPGDEVAEADMDMMHSIHNEIKKFSLDLQEGRV